MKKRMALESDLELEFPELGITVTVLKAAIIAMARKAHGNRRRQSQSGACVARVTGKRPERFQNRFSVYYEVARENGHGAGSSISGVFRPEAEERYRQDVASGRYSYVELRGPKAPQDKNCVVLESHGTKRER